MNKFQAAFEILYLLACADGEVDNSEINVILNSLNQNYSNISFDPSDIINSIDLLTPEGMYEELCTAVTSFKGSSTASERTALLEFAVELVLADGYVTDDEKNLLHAIANTWNINLNRFIDRYS